MGDFTTARGKQVELFPIEELIEHCDRQLRRNSTESVFFREHASVRVYLEKLVRLEARLAEVTAVVRCKNCVNYHDGTGWCDEHSCFVTSDGEFCTPAESSQWKVFDPEDFCSRAEKRE